MYSRPSVNSLSMLVPDAGSCLMTVNMAVNSTSAVSMRLMYLPNNFFGGITRSLSSNSAPVTIRKHGTAHIREAQTAYAVVIWPSVSSSM